MSPRPVGATIAERYDISLRYAKDECVPLESRPASTRFWPEGNVALLERFHAWLVEGGTSERSTDLFYVPMAGHVLGLNLKSHQQLDLEGDLERAIEYVVAKDVSAHWLQVSRNGLEKFRRFLRLERGLGEVVKAQPFDVARHAAGLPAWLVSELERFQRLQQRNWRTARIDTNMYGFWGTHIRVWRFLCEECNVLQFMDLKRKHILDYVDERLKAGYAVSGVNADLRTLIAFLVFLQGEGYPVPQSLLRIQGLKTPDSLPKYLTDEQVRLLRDDFEGRVVHAASRMERRNAILDRAMFYLLWQCGLRSGEVEELRLEDLDLVARKIAIRDGKGRKDRTVYATETTISVLQEYLAVRGPGSGDHVFLFRNAPLGKCLVHRRIKAVGERTGVKVYPHRLRHTCGTQLLNAGCRITSIQRFLGHKKLNTTMVYARAHDRTVADDYFKAMEQVEQRLELSLNGPNQTPSPREMLSLADSLFTRILDPDQHEMLSRLRDGLSMLADQRITARDVKVIIGYSKPSNAVVETPIKSRNVLADQDQLDHNRSV